jgi:copper chaperone NosL
MKNDQDNDRRELLKILAALGITSLTGIASAAEKAPASGALIPGKGWVTASGEHCPADGTPLQFIPKTAPDSNPLDNELTKYPKCPYCGMDRQQYHPSRHLVQYDDALVDGTCSIHCLAISLAINLDRGPKAIWAADYGAKAEVKPLVEVDKAVYLIGSKLPGTMTKKSKLAFASREEAVGVQMEQGGSLGGFDDALRESYLSLAEDTSMIRKKRGEMRSKMLGKGS